MNLFFKTLMTLALLLSFQACKNGTFYRIDNGILLRKVFYKGTLLSESQCKVFGKDTLLDGESKTYDSSFSLINILYWSHDKKYGKCLYFNKNGDTMVAGFYKNDLKDSIWYFYTPSLNNKVFLNAIENFRDGKLFGNNILYRQNHRLSDYYFYNLKGNIAYNRAYDQNGSFLKETDPVFLMVVSMDRGNNVLIGGVAAPTPPDCSVKLFSGLLLNNKDSLAWKPIAIKYNKASCYYSITKPGLYTWAAKMYFTDTLNGKQRLRTFAESYPEKIKAYMAIENGEKRLKCESIGSSEDVSAIR